VRAACKAEGGGRSHPCPSFSFLLRRAVLALTATTYYCTTMLRFSPYVAPPAAAIVHPVLSSSLSLSPRSPLAHKQRRHCVVRCTVGKRLPVRPVSPKLEREREEPKAIRPPVSRNSACLPLGGLAKLTFRRIIVRPYYVLPPPRRASSAQRDLNLALFRHGLA
jgi:hypothetical protein